MSNKAIKVYHGSKLLGALNEQGIDGFTVLGTVELTPAAKEYADFFAFWSNSKNYEKPSPFGEAFYESWFVETEDGERRPIGPPNVHANGRISWRYLR